MARRGGIGPGALRMGGAGRKPRMPPTMMATAPVGPPGGLGGPPSGGPSPMGIKKGGHVTKHARGGGVGEESPRHEAKESKREERMEDRMKTMMKHAKGGVVGGGDVKSRSGRDTGSASKPC